jgi:cystathionine gamma-synthase
VATPVGQSPFELGADLIVHATTKYLGGHGDLMGGAVIARVEDDMLERVRAVQASGGGIPSPFDCWLVLRGIQTLPWRVRAHAENALKLARFLADHRRVEAVHYPGLPSHPAHALAARQMRCFSGMLSFQVRGSAMDALGVAAKVRVFTRATSFGGTDSLIEHRASVEGPHTRTPENLLRVSTGLEHADDLIADLEEALS